eukprot:4886966-Pyramimonas_sp.AAC.1
MVTRAPLWGQRASPAVKWIAQAYLLGVDPGGTTLRPIAILATVLITVGLTLLAHAAVATL